MDDPVFRKNYQKSKYRLKQWEKEFKKKHGRIPSKLDIRESPVEIRNSYKTYYRLKTSLLEDTLLDALDEDDDFDGSLMSQESSFSQEVTDGSQSSFASGTIRNDSALSGRTSSLNSLLTEPIGSQAVPNRQIAGFEAEKEIEQNQNAWRNERSRQKPALSAVSEGTPEPSNSKPVAINVSKLMASPSMMMLPKRNPRKLMSRHSFSGTSAADGSAGSDSKMVLPDLETLLNAKSKDLDSGTKVDEALPALPSVPATREPINQLDERWLDRLSPEGMGSKATTVPSASGQSSKPSTANYGLRNVNLAAIASSGSFGMSSLSMSSQTNVPEGIQGVQATVYDRGVIPSDSDDVVENSEDECKKTSPGMLHVAKKRKIFTAINRSPQLAESKDDSKAIVPSRDGRPPMAQLDVENKDPMVDEKHPSDVKLELKKRKSRAPPNPKKVNVRKAAGNPQPTRARSVRTTRRVASYKEPALDTIGSGDFSSDDDDKDPDYERSKTANDQSAQWEDHASEILAEDHVQAEKPARRSRSTTRSATVPKAPRTRRSAGAKKSSPISPRLSPGSSNVGAKAKGRATKKKVITARKSKPPPTQETDEPDEYVPEYGLDRIKSVPRVDVRELVNDSRLADSFIRGVSVQAERSSSRSGSAVSSKEAALRKKMAAGKLNENFVRVDLRKKVFVKGKKTINYSRYKKSLWKAKKVAALSGPNMDMGGCDGGILTCFQCGGTGHMARECRNVREDKLLPLGVDVEEESAFPTLEEAEAMANAKTALVHSNRLEKLPPVANPTWKQPEREEECDQETEKKNEDRTNNLEREEKVPMNPPTSEKTSKQAAYIGHVIPEDFLKKTGILDATVAGAKGKIDPLYSQQPNGTLPATPPKVFEALHQFGHQTFRHGQERAVMRVLCGMSTLVTLSTGAGKSLCYQLPAYLYRQRRNCITLVISPLVSLMEDQVHGVPDFLNAQCLHKNQTPKVRDGVMAAIVAGEVDVLLVSPEAVVAGEKATGFGSLLRQLPPIAFACIDEAHCVSQWSHNFRPSYLMICKVLKEKLGVKTILGLTATATVQTRQSIVSHLSIPDGLSGIISDIPLPDNLLLTISRDENRDTALVELLHSERFSSLESIIVYCTRRDDCERIASFIRTCFQDAARARAEQVSNKRPRLNYVAEPYHAGMPASRRRTIQNAFMRGDLRIVVATIAFGMGINKADIRAIVHYNMPKNFESYVQEVGRAGRDGLLAHCHLFLDSHGKDRNELRRFIYANSIDRHVVRKLLQKIFVPCACVKNLSNRELADELRHDIEAANGMDWDVAFDEPESPSLPTTRKRLCPGHEICFSIESTIQQLDIPEENIATFLCYLELHEQRYIHALSPAYTMCKVMSYGGVRSLRQAAKECAPLAMAFALDLKRGISHASSTVLEFPVIDVAAAIGWDSGVVKYQLKNLEWTNGDNSSRKRSPLSVSFYDLGFRVRAPGDLSDEELDRALDTLYDRATRQERTQLAQLQYISDALNEVCFKTIHPVKAADCPTGPSEKLKAIIREYFVTDISKKDIEIVSEPDDTTDAQLVVDIRTMICRYPENNFTGRAIARIFHGVQSPNYSALTWSRSNFWRVYTKTDFNRIVRLANAEIVRMKT